jgi:hypothetical protein
MASNDTSLPPNRRIYCNSCRKNTNHSCLAEHYYIYPPDLPDEGEIDPNEGELDSDNREIDLDETLREMVGCRLWICAGCDVGTLEEYASFVFGSDPQTFDKQTYDSTYIPDRYVRHLQEKQYEALPKPIQSIYREVIRSFNAELHLLCAMGIRALLEGICANLQVKGRTLREMIDGLAPPHTIAHSPELAHFTFSRK